MKLLNIFVSCKSLITFIRRIELKQSQATRLDDMITFQNVSKCFFSTFIPPQQWYLFNICTLYQTDILTSWMSFLRNTRINQWKWYNWCVLNTTLCNKIEILHWDIHTRCSFHLIVSFSMILWQQSFVNCWQWSVLALLPYLSLFYLPSF